MTTSTLHPIAVEDHEYSTGPFVKCRIFNGGLDRDWCLDAVDATGNYSESCWSFDTFDQAVAALPEFWENLHA